MEGPVRRLEDAGFVVHMKNDGMDRWRLVRACIEEGVSQEALIAGYPARPDIPVRRDGVEAVLRPIVYNNPKRMVFRLDAGGESYILKRAYMNTIGLRRLFPRSFGLTYFTRVMRMVDAAVRNGCRATQGYFVVAEKWLSLFRQEIWLLLEYVEGEPMFRFLEDLSPRREALGEAVEELLAHGLTLDDLSLNNFLDDGTRVRVIDVSCRPFTSLQAAKMRMKMSGRYGLNLPYRGWRERLLARLLAVRYRLRRVLGGGGAR